MAAEKNGAGAGKVDESIFTLDANKLPDAVAALCFPDGDYAYDEKIGKKTYGKTAEKPADRARQVAALGARNRTTHRDGV